MNNIFFLVETMKTYVTGVLVEIIPSRKEWVFCIKIDEIKHFKFSISVFEHYIEYIENRLYKLTKL